MNSTTLYFCKRTLHISKAFLAKQGSYLNKILNRERKKHTNIVLKASLPISQPFSSKKPGDLCRRQKVLNALFMENISDRLSTGELAVKIRGWGIELADVRISSDYSHVNVYWIIPDSTVEKDTAASEMLYSVANDLRQDLNSCRVLGHVPAINFIRDKDYYKTREVEQLLAAADFGPDFTPSATTQALRKDTVIQRELSEVELEAVKEFEKQNPEEISSLPEVSSDNEESSLLFYPPPDMKQDIFGLNHQELMNQVMLGKRKSKVEFRFEVQTSELQTQSTTDSWHTEYETSKEDINQFIRSQKKKYKSSLKDMQTRLNREVYYEDLEERRKKGLEAVCSEEPFEVSEECDYYDESENVSYLKEETSNIK